MCGIAGALTLSGAPLDSRCFKPMLDAVAHRGPDDAGYLVWQTGRLSPAGGSRGQAFLDDAFAVESTVMPTINSRRGQEKLAGDKWNLFFGHRRLAVIDLSAHAHQPMSDRRERIWITFNGEVYNFRELREVLQSLHYEFKSTSDTEVVLYAYMEWGEDFVERLNGMFALAIWDSERQEVLLARDRYGIKPLYYAQDGDLLLFASEIKPIQIARNGGAGGVDLLALNEYLSFQNVLSDRTLFKGVRMLPAGSVMTISLRDKETKNRRYWDFDFSCPVERPTNTVITDLGDLITQAVRRQCVSDVPIGCYLSGGMDSCTVTAIATGVFGRLASFTAGFDLSEAASHEMAFDERELAERMASALQTEHYEVVLHSGDMEATLDWLIWHLEDLRVGQCYPNALVARLASKFVKVVMSGAGGDELFGGYPWRYAAAVGSSRDEYIANYYRYWKRLVPDEEKHSMYTQDTAKALSRQLGGRTPGEHTMAAFQGVFGETVVAANQAEQIQQSLYFECKTFLHGLLVVEDKLSMASSLETRVPFLDNELVDYACQIPVSQKLSGLERLKTLDENVPRKKAAYANMDAGTGKVILRKAMEHLLPDTVTGARKQGFSAPDESWFRGRSEAFVRRRLLGSRNRLHDYIRRDFVTATLESHCSGKANKRLLIWTLLSLESWLRQFDP